MARPIWTGAITFGPVSVPVAMYSATREHEVSFHQFEKGTSDRIRYRRVNERTGDAVEYDDIVDHRDTYIDRVNELIEAKEAGTEVTEAEAAPEPTAVTDLLAVLRRSVDDAKHRRGPAGKTTGQGAAGGEVGRREKPRRSGQGSNRYGYAGGGQAQIHQRREQIAGRGGDHQNDLLAPARDLDIAGRSSMSRPELEKAVKKAHKPVRRAS
jgi:hypothetical protein